MKRRVMGNDAIADVDDKPILIWASEWVELERERDGWRQNAECAAERGLKMEAQRDEALEEIASLQRTIAVWQAKVSEARDLAKDLRHILKSLDGVITAPALRGIDDSYPWLTEDTNA